MPTLDELLCELPPLCTVNADEVAHELDPTTVYVVIDDDPTGSQSVCDLPVLTRWDVDDFVWALTQGKPAVYVIANTRAMDPEQTEHVTRQIVGAALHAAQQVDCQVSFVSRSDSTLRGHFPLEPALIADLIEESGRHVDGIVIVPAFPDAGRITVNGTHYAKVSETYRPVGDTEFAQDKTFGFRSSDLRDWVEEKTQGAITASQVGHISLDMLRANLDAAKELLSQVTDRCPVVCDAADDHDLRRLALAIIHAEKSGKHFVYRVGPSFMRARIGQGAPTPVDAPLLRRYQGDDHTLGGLVVVGSHTGVTTRQLNMLTQAFPASVWEIDVRKLVGEERDAYIHSLADHLVHALQDGDVVVSTSRELLAGVDGADSLRISTQISSGVVEVVRRIIDQCRPRFVVSKGGITSSDIAAKALRMAHAWVVGPMLPGIISMWAAQDGPAVGVPYVVFPGNVGTDDSLAQVVATLKGSL